jgi:hypothetical protein
MLIPSETLAQGDAIATRWTVRPPCCDQPGEMDFLQYVNLEGWPGFREILRRREVDTFVCGCLLSHRFPAQVIVEVPRRNLLIYVTHGGDGPHIEEAFRADLSRLSPVPGRRPYTFVHGWQGLEAMLNIFDGRQPDGRGPILLPKKNKTWSSRPFASDSDEAGGLRAEPDSSGEDPGNSISDILGPDWLASIGCNSIAKLIGYSYGDLFFFDPKHRAVQSTVLAMVEFSAATQEPEHARRLAAIFEEFTDFMGPIHPWVVQEIGHLHLKAGTYEKAEKWLELAAKLEHRWLAVTRTFVDRTPSRRADAAPQDSTLPHSLPTSALGDVTRNRHVVIQLMPPVHDQDLWDFPQMADAAIPHVYSFKHALAVQGLIQGRLHRATLDERWLDLPGVR